MIIVTEQPTHIYGDSLKQQVEDRLKFYESGETPRKNIEVMKEAMELVASETPVVSEKKKKKKKRKLEETQNGSALNETNGDTTLELNGTTENGNGEPKKKKKKKKNKSQDD